jgi:outer membrane protein OmpA-like peptidoglycan-associated protein
MTRDIHLHRACRPTPRAFAALLAVLLLGTGCAGITDPYTTRRDNTRKGAAIGAASGAAAAILKGEREADEILAGAAIGAAIGTGVGVYMDRQEEALARIPGTTVERVEENLLLVRFDSNVLFDVDSAIVGGSGRASVDQVAGVLSQYPKTAVIVQGHTDSTGGEAHNQALSERRAGAVRGILVGQGVDSGRVTSIGYGEGYPVASNATDGGRRLNRRVDVLLKAKAT